MSVLTRLLDSRHLPDSINKDARAAQAITLLYTGSTSAVVTIDRHKLVTSVNGGSGTNLELDLADFTTLSALVTAINSNTGYTAAIAGGASATAVPLCLIEVDHADIRTTPLELFVATSVLWTVYLHPVAWQLELMQDNIQAGISEMETALADGKWLDIWGNTLGRVLRHPSETDTVYNVRLIKEVLRTRLTPRALALILSQDAGISVTLTDNQHDAVFVVGRSLVGGKILPDRLHSRDIFYLHFPGIGLPPQIALIKELVERNRAAGIMPVYPAPNLCILHGTGAASSNTVLTLIPHEDCLQNGYSVFVQASWLARCRSFALDLTDFSTSFSTYPTAGSPYDWLVVADSNVNNTINPITTSAISAVISPPGFDGTQTPIISASWDTDIWITNITSTGFTLHFSNPAPAGASVAVYLTTIGAFAAIPINTLSITVNFPFAVVDPYQVFFLPDWDTEVGVVVKGSTSVTVVFSNPAPASSNLHYGVVDATV